MRGTDRADASYGAEQQGPGYRVAPGKRLIDDNGAMDKAYDWSLPMVSHRELHNLRASPAVLRPQDG